MSQDVGQHNMWSSCTLGRQQQTWAIFTIKLNFERSMPPLSTTTFGVMFAGCWRTCSDQRRRANRRRLLPIGQPICEGATVSAVCTGVTSRGLWAPCMKPESATGRLILFLAIPVSLNARLGVIFPCKSVDPGVGLSDPQNYIYMCRVTVVWDVTPCNLVKVPKFFLERV